MLLIIDKKVDKIDPKIIVAKLLLDLEWVVSAIIKVMY